MTRAEQYLSKVPEVTLGFWIIKIAATTLGETGGDSVTMTLNWGYLVGTAIFFSLRFSVVLLIGVGGTLAWQSYGGEMVRAWAPSLGWLLPASPSAELRAQLKPVALDVAIMKRSVEQLASNQDQLARKQDQMTQAFATLQAAVRDINQNILALAPLAPKAGHVPPPKPPQSPAQ
jgi:Repeat of Unknown Function (DUF347)